MFHRVVLADKGLLLAFHKSVQALFPAPWLVDSPVPVSRFVAPLWASVFARCFTVNHRGKPGPLARVLSSRFHGLSWCFSVYPGEKQGLIPVLFVWVVLSDSQLSLPPPPSSCAPEIFFGTGAWSGANSNRDLPVRPLSAVTPAGVAFFTGQTAYGLLEAHRQTHRQAETKLLAQAALFAHACRW